MLILFFATVKLIAQQLEWGNIQNSKTSDYRPNIFGEDKNSIYIINYEKDNIAIEKFEKSSWNKIYSRTISANFDEYSDDANTGKFDRKLEGTTFLSNQFIVFTSGFDDNTKLVKLYASVYNAESGEKVKENIEIFKILVEKSDRKGDFGFLLSKNKKYLLIHHSAYHKKQKMYERHNLIIDGSLEIIIDKKETENGEDNAFTINNYLVDNEGSFYYLKKFSSSDTYLVSFDVNKSYEKWEEKIKLDDLKVNHSLSNITLDINEKNDVLISGTCNYLSERALKYPGIIPGELRGTFFMRLDNYSKEFVVNKISFFSKEFLNSFRRTEKQIKKDELAYIPDNYSITKILSKKDGGCIFIAESFSISTLKSGTRLDFSDILIINLSGEGDMVWQNRIRKWQVIYNSFKGFLRNIRYFSYAVGYSDKTLYILYNQSPENIEKIVEQEIDFCSIHKGVPAITSIDLHTGEMNTEVLEDLNKSQIHLMPSEYFQVSQNSDFILFAQDKNIFKFGVMKFKQ